jgi:hypothetical protein
MFLEKYYQKMKEAESYLDLSDIAIEILSGMPQPVSMVSGPISSGGRGSIKENLSELKRVVSDLKEKGDVIFDNLSFEEHISRIRSSQSNLSKEESNQILLEEFYGPIFDSGFIKRIFFLPDWESSQGASWEHGKAEELDMDIVHLD